MSRRFLIEGNLFDEKADENLTKAFPDDLVWMSKTLRSGRENLPSKYHRK